MIVEFIGAPGAGKTTIAQATRQVLQARGLQCVAFSVTGYETLDGVRSSARDRRLERVRALATQPRSALRVARCLAGEGRGEALSWAINLARRNRTVRDLAGQGGVVILEEGPLNALCLWSVASKHGIRLPGGTRGLQLPDVVVHLHVDPMVAAERVRRRQGILSDLTDEAVIDLVNRYGTAAALVATAAEQQVPVLRYEASGQGNDLAEQLAQDLATRLPPN